MPRDDVKKTVLRLLEGYVLAALERLPAPEEAALEVLARHAFGKAADWRRRVREELGLSPELDAQLAAMWAEASRLACERGEALAPSAFARWVVEENFVDAVELVSTELAARARRG